MKIIVLNGSPKGELSVTMQSVAYLAKLHPEHEFDVVHIAQRIRHFEKDRAAFDKLMEQIRASDAVLWGFPLYILIVHANYKRFIELIFERGTQNTFTGKYAAALSTSIHFFDHTAHNYIHGICDDLGMRFVDSFSADMDDLTKKEGRQQLENFGRQFFNAVKNQVPTQRQYPPLVRREFTYQPVAAPAPLSTSGKKVVILHDEKDTNSNLAKMVDRCRASFTDAVTVVNIHDLNIKSSCLGCIECGSGKKCAFTDKDDYIEFYKSTVMTADILIYAGQMVDRYLSSRWKMFFDRIFFNTHTPVLIDKQVALVISGPLSQNPNLLEILRGFFEFQGANLSGVVTDEYGDSAELDRLLDQLLARTLKFSAESYTHPMTYLGVGGMKVFRDDVYGRLRFVFDADHRAYKRMGVYKTFPQTEFKNMLFNTFIAPIINFPPIRKQFDGRIKKEMVAPHKKVVEKALPT
ncbi:MAG TPA: NAD(P)H-dependent oxidoreductase, partial [Anaerolineales bacterium]|nr:NAD(P)H-dependent oxidoreductase [Anaerolineales bacterium]